MANVKKIIAEWSETGKTVYCIIRREADSYLLDSTTGSFGAAPANPYLALSENATIKGLYEVSESRQVWNDGRYTISVYKQAGVSPAPAADMIIGAGDMFIVSDSEVVVDQSISTRTPIVRTGTAQAGSGNTITLDAGASATNNIYNWMALLIISGTGAGQVGTIFQYNGTTKVASMFNAWYINPDSTSVFVILPTSNTTQATYQTFNVLDKIGYSTDQEIRKNYLQPGSTTTNIVLDVGASSVDNFYNGDTIIFITGLAAGLTGIIQSYSGATKTATLLNALLIAPDGGSNFAIYPPSGGALTALAIDTQLSGTHGAGSWQKASGTGNVAVSDSYPTVDYLRVLDAVTSLPLSGVRIIAYLTADYNAGNLGQAFIQGESVTKNDGRWLVPIYLLSGQTYTLVFVDNGYVTNTITLVVI